MPQNPERRSRQGRTEVGIATVWSLAWMFLCLTLAWVGLALGAGVAAQHHLDASADLVALSAAADLQHGRDACAAAADIAERNQVELSACRVEGADVVVRVGAVIDLAFGLRPRITAAARAGPG